MPEIERLFSLDKPRHAPATPALAEPSLPRPAYHQKSMNILTDCFEGPGIELLVTQPEQKSSKGKVLCLCKHGAYFLYVKMARNPFVPKSGWMFYHFQKRRYLLVQIHRKESSAWQLPLYAGQVCLFYCCYWPLLCPCQLRTRGLSSKLGFQQHSFIDWAPMGCQPFQHADGGNSRITKTLWVINHSSEILFCNTH